MCPIPTSAQFSEELERLDALANEASFLNDYSSSESITSEDYNHETSYLNCFRHHPQETTPLLPTHVSPTPNTPVSPPSRLFLEFMARIFWTYVLTDRIRSYIIDHKRMFIVIGFVLVLMIAGVLAYTDHFLVLFTWCKMVWCYFSANGVCG